MMKGKSMMLVSVVVLFAATSIATADTELCSQINEYKDKAAFFVAYSKEDGKPIAIIESLSSGCTVVDQGKEDSIPIDILIRLKEHDEKKVDIVSFPMLHVHGSPGCYVPKAGGGWKCVCCP